MFTRTIFEEPEPEANTLTLSPLLLTLPLAGLFFSYPVFKNLNKNTIYQKSQFTFVYSES